MTPGAAVQSSAWLPEAWPEHRHAQKCRSSWAEETRTAVLQDVLWPRQLPSWLRVYDVVNAKRETLMRRKAIQIRGHRRSRVEQRLVCDQGPWNW